MYSLPSLMKAAVAATRKSRDSEFPQCKDLGARSITSRFACSHCWLDPKSAICSALLMTGSKIFSS